jgi:GntR family transcriptional regulator/MocR family aminotransferase
LPEWSTSHPFPNFWPDFGSRPATFQVGVPAQDVFPFKL